MKEEFDQTQFELDVREDYANALENEYYFEGYSLEDIARDMIAFSSTMEEYLEQLDEDDDKLADMIVKVLDMIVESSNEDEDEE